MYKLFQSLYANLNETAILYGNERIVLWDLPDVFSYKENVVRLEFEHKFKIKEIVNLCNRINGIVNPIANNSSVFKRVYYFFFDKTLGHIDYVKLILSLG